MMEHMLMERMLMEVMLVATLNEIKGKYSGNISLEDGKWIKSLVLLETYGGANDSHRLTLLNGIADIKLRAFICACYYKNYLISPDGEISFEEV